MRIMSIFMTGLVFAASAAAAQNNVCSSVAGIAKESATDFKSLRGAKDAILGTAAGVTQWHATTNLPNANDCSVTPPEGLQASYSCTWQRESEDEAREVAKSFISDLRSCNEWIITEVSESHSERRRGQSDTTSLKTNKPFDFDVGVRRFDSRKHPDGLWSVELTINGPDRSD